MRRHYMSSNALKHFVESAFQGLTIFAKIQPAIACSKLTIETLEQGVKYVQS